MAGVGAHGVVEGQPDSREAVRTASTQELALDRLQGEDRLAEGEGQLGAHLEDGEAVLDQRAERLLVLVIGGVGLVDETVRVGDRCEPRRALPAVGEDGVVAELDAGLDHEGEDPPERALQARVARRPRG